MIMLNDWVVTLSEIEWDDGGGMYDVSGLPRTARYVVDGDADEDSALEYAMEQASEDYGSLIVGCRSHVQRVE